VSLCVVCVCVCVSIYKALKFARSYSEKICQQHEQEAQLSPRDRAMRRVS